VKELIAYAKARPGQVSFASSGVGSPSHLGMELFKSTVGMPAVHVPYKGIPQALADMVSGQITMSFGLLISALPQVKSGRVRARAVMSHKRIQGMPDLPTAGETVKGYESSIWHGVLMPKFVPPAILRQVNREINELLKLPEVRERMAGQGAETVGGSPEDFAAWIKADTEKYSKLLKQIGLAGTEK